MAVRPIIFSAPMVRRLIALGKTQTRRLATSPLRKCEPGDLLYVRESWQALSLGDYQPTMESRYADVRYAATDPLANSDQDVRGYAWRPSIHMPRWASRIALQVEGVRIEPLQSISHEDCIAEGVEPLNGDGPNFYTVALPGGWNFSQPTPRPCYEQLWRELHGDASWDANPDVLVLTFKPLAGNVDRLAA